MNLGRLLAREQRAFLKRDRQGWGPHLDKTRAFFQEAFRHADATSPVLVLGAGTGLEISWASAPENTTGWDADPWSRLGTALRHRRFPSWIFEDFTGGFRELKETAKRAVLLPGSQRRRDPELAARRLAGLLPSLNPSAAPLRAWIDQKTPGTILVANVLGQLGYVAERTVESVFRPVSPWAAHPDDPDLLEDALDAWTLRTVQAVMDALKRSGASIWMVHDRAVMHGHRTLRLGPLEEDWMAQLKGPGAIEISDPLLGLDLQDFFGGWTRMKLDRWLWPVGPAQTHLMEAMAFAGYSAQPNAQTFQTV